MDEIRLIRPEELAKIREWWRAFSGNDMNVEVVYPMSSTFVYKKDNTLLYAVAAQKVEDSPLAYIDGFIKNPKESSDHHAVSRLQSYMESFLKAQGYQVLVVTTKDIKVNQRHKELGYNSLETPLFASYKELK